MDETLHAAGAGGHGVFQLVERFDVFGHDQALRVFLGFIDFTSSTSGCCASCGC